MESWMNRPGGPEMPPVSLPREIGAPLRLVRAVTPWVGRNGVALAPWCHGGVVGRFEWACDLAYRQSDWVPRRIDSYNARRVRGSRSISRHAAALAWDFFDRPLPNPVDVWGRTNAPDDAFLEAFRQAGFRLGGTFSRRPDWPHIEWPTGVLLPSLVK